MIQRSDLALFLIYLAAYWPMLINGAGIYFDDWIIYYASPEALYEIYRDVGFPWSASVHSLLSRNIGPGGIRHITFWLFFFSGLFVYKLLKSFLKRHPFDCFVIASFFMIMPINHDRQLTVNFISTTAYFCFFAGLYLLPRSLKPFSKVRFTIVCLLYFYALLIPTFAPLYFILIGVLFLGMGQSFRKSVDKVIYLILFIIPFLSLWIKLLFPALNRHKEVQYGSIYLDQLENFVSLCYTTLNTIISSITMPILPASFLLLFVLIALLRWIFLFPKSRHKIYKEFLFIFLGFIILIVSLAPYLLLKKYPVNFDWNGRHQLLLAPGLSLLFYFCVKQCIHPWFKRGLFALLTLLFIYQSNLFHISYINDWFKQQALMVHYKEHSIFYQNRTFLFEDPKGESLVNHRKLRFYEYSGQFRQIFGDQKRLGSDSYLIKKYPLSYLEERDYFKDQYNTKDYKNQGPIVLVKIIKTKNLSLIGSLHMVWLKFWDSKVFKDNLRQLLVIETSLSSRSE